MAPLGALQPPSMNTIDLGDERLGYRRHGTGPDLVLIHGWPLTGATFRHVVPHLEERFTCHVLDLVGAGASEWHDGSDFRLEAHAGRVVRAIDRLGLKKVGFVGHDSGGCIARIAAAELDARCTGIVSGNTEIAGYRPPLLRALIATRSVPGAKAAFPRLLGSRAFRRSVLGFGGAFDDLACLDGEFGERFVAPLRDDPRAFAGQWNVVRDFSWSTIDELAVVHRRITAPVRFVWGKDDPWFPLEKLRPTLGQFAGGADVLPIAGKLFVHEEHPALFAQHVAEHFGARLRSAA